MKKRRMKRTNRRLFVGILMILVITLSVGYSSLNSNLKIMGVSNIRNASWDIHFDNISVTPGSVSSGSAKIDDTLLKIDYNCSLIVPGNFYEFNVDIINNGSIDAKLSGIPKLTGISSDEEKFLNYSVTYEDGSKVLDGDSLLVNSRKRLKVRIEFRRDITVKELPKDTHNLSLEFSMNYVQA